MSSVTKDTHGTAEYEVASTQKPKARAIEVMRADMNVLLNDTGQPPLADGEGVVTTTKPMQGPIIGGSSPGWKLTVTRKSI